MVCFLLGLITIQIKRDYRRPQQLTILTPPDYPKLAAPKKLVAEPLRRVVLRGRLAVPAEVGSEYLFSLRENFLLEI